MRKVKDGTRVDNPSRKVPLAHKGITWKVDNREATGDAPIAHEGT